MTIPSVNNSHSVEFLRMIDRYSGNKQPNRLQLVNSYLPFLAPLESKGTEARELADHRNSLLRLTESDQKKLAEDADKHPRM